MLKDKMSRVWERLVKKYRLVFYDHESLSQTRFLMVRPLTLILMFSLFTTAVVAGTTFLIFYSPTVREQIPGYLNPKLEKDYQELEAKTAGLEKFVEEQDSLLTSFKRMAGLNSDEGATWTGPVEGSIPNESDGNSGQQPQTIVKEVVRVETVFVDRKIPANLGAVAEAEPGVMNLLLPVDGVVTKSFNPKEKHYGVDIAADEESLIRAVSDGVVIHSEYSTQNGFVIGIAHQGSKLVTYYKHNSRVFKSVGSYVFAGEAIAVIGNTGKNTSGMHLHFEIWYEGSPMDPEDYVQFN